MFEHCCKTNIWEKKKQFKYSHLGGMLHCKQCVNLECYLKERLQETQYNLPCTSSFILSEWMWIKVCLNGGSTNILNKT